MRVFTRLPMRDWHETQQAARDIEATGFDAAMTVELGHDVFAPLAIAALSTERVELTPSVAVAFPRSPTVLASRPGISRRIRVAVSCWAWAAR